MNKIFAVQISLMIMFGSGLGYLLINTDVYQDVQENIVSTVCLSCIKMYPVPKFEFIFETQNGEPHPGFVIDNLTKGPIFLAYRKTVCDGCEIMDPLLRETFDVDFGLGDYEKYIDFEGTTIYFRHINIDDHHDDEFKESYSIYGGLGVPMFVALTLGGNNGNVEPYYRLEYGTLGLDDDSARKEFLRTMMRETIKHYNENIEKYAK